jgi:hypothetical protein
MKAIKKERKNNLGLNNSLKMKLWVYIPLFVLAAAIIGSGFYVNYQSNLSNRADIRLYNQGVSTYYLPAVLLPATEDRPSEYPLVRAVAYFQQVISETKDNNIKALALYNLGTLMGKDTPRHNPTVRNDRRYK